MSVRRTVALALSATLALTGLSAATAPAALAADTAPYEVTIDPRPLPLPPERDEFLQAAGTGLQVRTSPMLDDAWRDPADGQLHMLSGCSGSGSADHAYHGDRVACFWTAAQEVRAVVYDYATGGTVYRDRPADHQWLKVLGADRLVAYRQEADGSLNLQLLGIGENAPADLTVRIPGPAPVRPWVVAFDGAGALLAYSDGRNVTTGHLDFATGAFRVLPPAGPAEETAEALGTDRVVRYEPGRALVLDRRDAADQGRSVALPAGEAQRRLGVLGDWIVGPYRDPAKSQPLLPLKATSLTTGLTRDLGIVVDPYETPVVGSTGDLYFYGGRDTTQWGIQRISLDAAGLPAPTRVWDIAATPVPRTGLRMANGRIVAEEDGIGRTIQGYEVSVASPRTVKPTSGCRQGEDAGCYSDLLLTGDGRTIGMNMVDGPPRNGGTETCWGCDVQLVARGPGGTVRTVILTYPGRLSSLEPVGASGRFVHFLANEGGYRRSYVADIETGRTVKPGNPHASLWGNRIWTSSWSDDRIFAIDARTGATTETIDLGTGCVNQAVDVHGRWIHASCATGDWVYDRDRKTKVKIPLSGRAYVADLGDGVVLRSDEDAERLDVVDVRSGAAVTRSVTVAGEKPDTGGSWALDAYTNTVGFIDGNFAVRLAGLGGATSRLTTIDADVPAGANVKSASWKPRWWLSKPGASWTLTLRHKATGRTVRTLAGGEARGVVAPVWDGRDAAGKYAANGAYAWTLAVRPVDGQGADLTASGTVALSGAAAVWRDMAGDDGFGDLLVTDTAGATSLYRGTGTGGVSARIAGGGTKFPTTALLVPVGDLNGDRCTDVYARVGDQLRAYRPGCGKVVTASSPYTLVGSGWGGYDVLTSPGDVNGDGHADLVARQASNGDVYFYPGTATHLLKSRVRIGTNWKLYKKLVGAGDLNGDGRGDLLGVDASGVLWRYHGTATGGVTARVRVGGGWGGYSALAGVGDLSGDGRADLLARDTAGKLWRYASTGTGPYGARVLVGASGWNGFKGLF